jgi:TetR/AcrR family transcriptional repressor of nem operon
MVAELVGALSLARVEPDSKRSDAILSDSRRALKHRLNLEA